jgi:hypothetical protein
MPVTKSVLRRTRQICICGCEESLYLGKMPRAETWNVMTHRQVDVHRRFEGIYCNLLQGRKGRQATGNELQHVLHKQIPWLESASELYRPSDRCLSVKLAPTLANRGCHVVSVTDPYGRNLGFLDRTRPTYL